jgi:hypothetical protein
VERTEILLAPSAVEEINKVKLGLRGLEELLRAVYQGLYGVFVDEMVVVVKQIRV